MPALLLPLQSSSTTSTAVSQPRPAHWRHDYQGVAQLNAALKAALAQTDLERLAQQLGYPKTAILSTHLNSFIIDQPYLGLVKGHYDLTMGSRGLLLALVKPLGLSSVLVNDVLEWMDYWKRLLIMSISIPPKVNSTLSTRISS